MRAIVAGKGRGWWPVNGVAGTKTTFCTTYVYVRWRGSRENHPAHVSNESER